MDGWIDGWMYIGLYIWMSVVQCLYQHIHVMGKWGDVKDNTDLKLHIYKVTVSPPPQMGVN